MKSTKNLQVACLCYLVAIYKVSSSPKIKGILLLWYQSKVGGSKCILTKLKKKKKKNCRILYDSHIQNDAFKRIITIS